MTLLRRPSTAKFSKSMRKVLSIGTAVLVLTASVLIANPKPTYAAPFACEPAFYQVISGNLKKLDPTTGLYRNMGVVPPNMNAIGYNTEDNFIYGILNSSGNLGRISLKDLDDTPQDGSINVSDLGVPVGVSGGSFMGDFDNAGNLYVAASGTSLYKIDVSAMTATTITLSANITGSHDLVHVNGKLYSTNGTTLFEINITNGTVTSKPLGLPAGVYGAGWATVDSRLYFGGNNGTVYRITNFASGTPSGTLVLEGEQTMFSNDGASCAMTTTVILDITAVNDVGSVAQNTVLTVPASTGLLANDSGSLLTVTSNTQPSNGVVVVNPDGSYTYTPNQGYSGLDTFTYTITDSVGSVRTATVTIAVGDTQLPPLTPGPGGEGGVGSPKRPVHLE